jgi:hypothetical protein
MRLAVLLAISAGTVAGGGVAAARVPVLAVDVVDMDHGARWRVQREVGGGVARVASGPGLHLLAHGAPAAAELDAAGRAFLDRHAGLFAAPAAQLALVAAREVDPLHSVVVYDQVIDGLPVLGGRVHLLFRGPALVVVSSTAEPAGSAAGPRLGAAAARAAALAGLDAAGVRGQRRVVRETPALWRGERGLRAAWQLEVATAAPLGRWEVVIDGESGAVLRHADLIPHGVVQVTADVVPAQPGGVPVRQAVPRWAPEASLDGRAEVPGGALTVSLEGPLARLTDPVQPIASHSFTVGGGAETEELLWPAEAAPPEQIDAWVWTHRAIEYGRALAPDLDWLSRPLGIHVNFDDGSGFPYCNAFYMPRTFTDEPTHRDIHFFRAGGNAQIECVNTASLAGVVLHEWGHGFHDHLLPAGLGTTFDEVERSISEGVGDYVSATVLDDPVVPIDAIAATTSPTQIDPRLADNQLRYPVDLRTNGFGQADVHWNGQIWAGTFWDLRAALRERHGAVVGTRMADDLHARVLRAGPSWVNAYELAITLDDDDGDPTNGSPHSCEINAAFAAHGLAPDPRPARGSLRLEHDPAAASAGTILAAVSAAPGCGELDPASVELRYLAASGQERAVPMTARAGQFEAALPADAPGGVMSYRIAARTTDGAESTWPAGGGRFGVIVGGGAALAHWDFEDGGAGWTHGAEGEAPSDWEFGPPAGRAGDPDRAASGSLVAGTDLGGAGNGAYDPATMSWLESPPVSCGDCRGLRLRLRRVLSLAAGDVARISVGGTTVWEITGPLQDPGWVD